MDFGMGGIYESVLLYLLNRMLDVERYMTNGYRVYERRPYNKGILNTYRTAIMSRN